MAFDAFLKLDGIPGESTDDKHKDWIELLSYNWGATQMGSATASSSGGASRWMPAGASERRSRSWTARASPAWRCPRSCWAWQRS